MLDLAVFAEPDFLSYLSPALPAIEKPVSPDYPACSSAPSAFASISAELFRQD